MSALRVWLLKYRLPLAVTGGHFAVILVFCIFWSYEPPSKKRAVIKVGLVSLASGGAPPSPAPVSPTVPAPTAPARTQKKKRIPKPSPKPKTTSARKKLAKPKTPSKPKWKPRSIEDIRKSATTTTRRQVTTTTTSRRNDNKLSKVKASLTRQLASGTHASTMLGEPASVPPSYLGQVQAIIYRKWRQPSRTEVGNRDHTVTIQLQIRKDGTLAGSRIVHRSPNLVMNESVTLLLRNLTRVPALPAEFKQSQLRLDIVLNLQ